MNAPSLISQAFIQELLAHVDILNIVEKRLTLKKRGNNYWACCPFHQENTPSFCINNQKQFYYCFGCHVHGNAINFLMAFDRLEFMQAIALLAKMVGKELPTLPHQQTALLPEYPVLKRAADFFQYNLRKSQVAIEYLKQRGITGISAKTFALGFAKDHWHDLSNGLGKNPKLKEILLSQGLLIKKDQGEYDYFRNRIMFPIRDVKGRVVGFGGRVLGKEQPKYLNSKETAIFHKSRHLYGLYEMKKSKKSYHNIIVVEGYMDVIVLHQYGLMNAVATLGTAINLQHLQHLLKETNEIIFCFDGDAAGKAAAWKALQISLPIVHEGLSLKFLFLPLGDDPDSFMRRMGAEVFQKQISQALGLSEFFFLEMQQGISLASLDDKALFAKKVFNFLAPMPKGLFYELMLNQLATILAIPKSELIPLQVRKVEASSKSQTLISKARLTPAETAMAILLQEPCLVFKLPDEWLSVLQNKETALLRSVIEFFKQFQNQGIGALLEKLDLPEDKQKIAELSCRPLPIPKSGFVDELQGSLLRIKETFLESHVDQLLQKAKTNGLDPLEKKELHSLLVVGRLKLDSSA